MCVLFNFKEEKTMNKETVKQYIKMGELKAILKNVDKDGKIKHNSIALVKSDAVLLRTNGAVLYGLYDPSHTGNFSNSNKEIIHFTHDLIKPQPFVKTADYMVMKPRVLKAYSDIFNDYAKQKLQAVRFIIANHEWYKEQLNKIQEPQATIIQEPTITIEKKEEVQGMKIKLNVMMLAHSLRKQLKLEGNYRVQMAIALSYAHDIKNGMTLQEAEANLIKKINTKKSKLAINKYETIEATAPTYNVAPQEPEQRMIPANTCSIANECYLVRNEDHYLVEVKNIATGKTFRYPSKIAMPNENAAYIFLNKIVVNLAKGLPNNTRMHVSPLTYNTRMTKAELMTLCKNKNIELVPFVSHEAEVV